MKANHDEHVENAKLLSVLGGTNMVVGTDGPKSGRDVDGLDGLAKGIRSVADRIAELGYKGDFSIEMFSQTLWALPPAEAARQMYQSLLPLCE